MWLLNSREGAVEVSSGRLSVTDAVPVTPRSSVSALQLRCYQGQPKYVFTGADPLWLAFKYTEYILKIWKNIPTSSYSRRHLYAKLKINE